jgi:hypothetical protein
MAGLAPFAEPVDPLEGGLDVDSWLRLWKCCHAATGQGIWRTSWPDDTCALQQPALTIAMFDVLSNIVAKEIYSDGK